MKFKNLIYFFFWIAVFPACQKGTEVSDPYSIYGFWRYQNGVDVEIDGNLSWLTPLAHVSFEEDGTMSGFTSRNILGGTFKQAADEIIKLDFNPLTRVYDTPWSSRFEKMLSEVDHFRLEENQLYLTNSNTADTLEFLRMSPEVCQAIINDSELFENASSDDFSIEDVVVAGDCLEISISYGGGCGMVNAMLTGSGNYMESFPQQLHIKLVLEDNDPCEALVHKSFHFDLNTVLPQGEDEIILHLEGWEMEIRYRKEA